jgi:hypothetical protein
MIPNQNGTTVSFAGGNTLEFDMPFALESSWVFEECELIVFLQDNSTKEIFQATKLPLTSFTPEYQYDATVKQVIDLPKTSCTGSFAPEVNIRNIGGATMNSVDITYSVNNGESQSYAWAGSLDYLGEEIVSLPPITFTGEDNNEITVYTSNPNGNSDECPENDTRTVTVPDAMHTPNTVKLMLRTDANPGETTWELKNSAGEVLYQGGPYSISGQMVQQTFDLVAEDCFTFIIYDSGGDGLVIPSFYMLYYGTNTVINQGQEFGFKEMVDINTIDVVGLGESKDDVSVEVFPNPIQDKAIFAVSLEKPAQVSIKVFAIAGQVIMNVDEGILEAGKHGIVLDATSWKPALYLYQVKAGEQVFTGKLTVN